MIYNQRSITLDNILQKAKKGGMVTGLAALALGGATFISEPVSAQAEEPAQTQEKTHEVQMSNQMWEARSVDDIKANLPSYNSSADLQNYEVMWGDTLWGISQATGLTVEELTDTFNITNPDLIFANYTLGEQKSLPTYVTPEMSDDTADTTHSNQNQGNSGSGSMSMGMNMNHKRQGSPAPESMVAAEDPMYPVGSQALIADAHMEIMNGAIATISGAYDTTLYTVTFTPEDSNQPIEDHKWVVEEEVETEDGSQAEVGDTVILRADHMAGMNGQKAEITGKQEGPAYMVDFQPTDGSEPFTNHKWVSENELQPVEQGQESQNNESIK